MIRLIARTVTLIVFCAASMVAKADLLLDSFAGPDPGYDPNISAGIGFTSKVARPFEVTSNSYLTSIQVAMFGFADPATFGLSICGDDGHSHPGSAIESFVSNFPTDDNAILTFDSVSNPLLAAGTYYVVVSSITGIGGWDFTGDHHTHAIQSYTGTQWQNSPNHIDLATRVFGSATPVPEPASFSIVAIGLLAMKTKRRRKNR